MESEGRLFADIGDCKCNFQRRARMNRFKNDLCFLLDFFSNLKSFTVELDIQLKFIKIKRVQSFPKKSTNHRIFSQIILENGNIIAYIC